MKYIAVLVAAVGLLAAGCERKESREPASSEQVPPQEQAESKALMESGQPDQQTPGVLTEGVMTGEKPQVKTSKKKMKAKPKTLTPEERRAREGAEDSTRNVIVPESPEDLSAEVENEEYAKEALAESPKGEVTCPESPYAHPRLLRADLAYSVTGLDCFGDLPTPVGEVSKAVGRSIASEPVKCGPYDHPMFLRQDMEWSVTRQDCRGNPVEP